VVITIITAKRQLKTQLNFFCNFFIEVYLQDDTEHAIFQHKTLNLDLDKVLAIFSVLQVRKNCGLSKRHNNQGMGKLQIKIGINPSSWTSDNFPELGGETPLETCLAEGSEIGYEGFELGKKFPKAPDELHAKLAEYGISVVSEWYPGSLAENSLENEIEAVQPLLKKFLHNDCAVLVYGEIAGSIQTQRQTPLSRRPRFVSINEWKEYASKLDVFGTYLKSNGIKLAYHPHVGSYCESTTDLDILMQLTSTNVGLLFDTGQITFAGGNALAELKKHISRVIYVHCTDVRQSILLKARNADESFLNSVLDGIFTVPGDGMIDFEPILQELADHHYTGWLVIAAEQDPTVAPSYEYATNGYNVLASIVRTINEKA